MSKQNLSGDLRGAARARELFSRGEWYLAGKVYCRGMTAQDKVRWTARVLTSLHDGPARFAPVTRTLELASNPDRWGQAYDLFQELRQLRLKLLAEERGAGILALAEKVAKLAYNATSPSAPFDADSAERFAECFGD